MGPIKKGNNGLLLFLFLFLIGLTGCGRKGEMAPPPPSPPKVATIEDFSLQAFVNLRKVIGKYTYILLNWEYPKDKICLGEIKVKNKVIPPYFDYYIDLKQLMGSSLVLIEPPTQQCDEVIKGNVVVEALGSRGNRWEGDLDSDKIEGSGAGSHETLTTHYRILMSLTLSAYPSWEVDSATQNIITYRERERGIDLALSFLNFSIGYSQDVTKKDSIIRTLKALSDFSLVQIVSKNYALPFWYLYPNEILTPNRALSISQQGIFKKYLIKYARRAGLPLGGIFRRGLVALFGIPKEKLKKETVWRLNPTFTPSSANRKWSNWIIQTALQHNGYCPPPSSPIGKEKYLETRICLPIENPNRLSGDLNFTRYEEILLKRVITGVLRDNLIGRNTKRKAVFKTNGFQYQVKNRKHLYILLIKPLANRLRKLANRPFSELSSKEKEELIAILITAINPLIPPEVYRTQWNLPTK